MLRGRVVGVCELLKMRRIRDWDDGLRIWYSILGWGRAILRPEAEGGEPDKDNNVERERGRFDHHVKDGYL